MSTTVYLHRGLAHRAVKFNPWLEGILRFFVWLTTTVVRQEWVAVHRKHHAYSDQEGDPHSPAVNGFWNIQLWNYFYYRREADKPEVVQTYSKDIAYDWFDRFSKFSPTFLC
ncbi:MAG: fatty acid desaturase [Bdellovibrionota bacterium]